MLNVVDLFSGAGGFHIGFRNAGFNVVLSNDINPQVKLTHQHNYKDIPFTDRNIRELSGEEIKTLAGVNKIDVLIGGPPCQGFSTIGNRVSSDPNKRYNKDERNDLVFEFIRMVKELQPKYFVMENVKGITTINKGVFFKVVMDEFNKLDGYKVDYCIMNVADYGVPQVRYRTIIIGNRLGHDIEFPEPTHSQEGENGLKKWERCWDVLEDLCELNESKEFNHVPLRHTEKNIARYKYIPEGGRLPEKDLPPELYRKNFGNTFKRLHREQPALTMVPGNDAFPIHPVLHRSLTVREAARIQGFSDDIIFMGNRRQQGHQVGNAVPPAFAKIIANTIKGRIEEDINVKCN